METLYGILILLGLLLVIAVGLWALLIRANKAPKGFYGLDGWHYAHRGLHNSAREVPENSKKAFQLAVRYGYGAELDVQLSKDKRLVVMHDETLKRTAGLDMRVGDATTEILRRLRLEGTEQEVPYLEEVLPMFEGKAPLVIEIKPCGGDYARLTYRVCKLLDQYPGLQLCIESFDPRVIFWLRKNRPEIVRGQLSTNFMKDRHGLKWIEAFLLTNLLLNGFTQPDFIAYRFEDRNNLSLQLCRLLWRPQEFFWTVRSQEDADAAAKRKAAIIFEGFAARRQSGQEPAPADARQPAPQREAPRPQDTSEPAYDPEPESTPEPQDVPETYEASDAPADAD